MLARSLSHLSDRDLLEAVRSLFCRQRRTTAEILLHLAEIERRRLHHREAHPSLSRYCIDALGLSEGSAIKHARAARVVRRFPEVLDAVAEGRLHLSAIVMLAPHLERDSGPELLAAAEHRSKAQIEQLLAERFPRQEVASSLVEIAPTAPVPHRDVSADAESPPAEASASTSQLTPGTVVKDVSRQGVSPLSPARFEVRFTLDAAAREKLRRAEELLSHAVPPGDLAGVFTRALDVLVERLEKRVCAATSRPRGDDRARAPKGRHVPAAVRREVWVRDEGRCAFVSESGNRCVSRTFLQIDHVRPRALGGESSVTNLRLLCRAHNRHEADRLLGERFMHGRCEQARADRTRQRTAPSPAPSRAHIDEVVPVLMALEYRRQEAREGAELCAGMAGESLEARVKVALRGLMRARFVRGTAQTSTAG